ncbi:nuclear transport factor 2 family protein [Actinomadura kijaniata]|uniref:nuclear transport factor 2 family protein n=1 Tax=Actinomadura kijaniata TaxID=46161 RepID=UPI003F1B8C89
MSPKSWTAELYAEVQQFYARHLQLLDSGRADEWADTFTADAVFDVPTLPEPVRGREGLRGMVRAMADRLARAGEIHRHWHSMPDVRTGPDGVVRVRSYALVFVSTAQGSALHRVCVCEDVLVREAGDLKVRSRRVDRDDLAADAMLRETDVREG